MNPTTSWRRFAKRYAIVAVVLAGACSPDGMDATQDTYDPECGGDTEPAVYECPSGVYECPDELACVGGLCVDNCSSAYQCYPLDGCRTADNVCGLCLYDADCRSGEGCTEGVCLPDHIPQWELYITDSDWVTLPTLSDSPTTDQENDTVPCELNADGVVYDQDVQVKFRGGSTLKLPERSFRIEFPEDADHPGFQRKINLRAEYNDPSVMRTFLAFETARRWSINPTPKVRYIDLYLRTDQDEDPYLDDNYYGLVIEIERLGGKFLEDNNRNRDLPLLEAKWVDRHGTFTPDEEDYEEFYIQSSGTVAGVVDVEDLIEEVLEPDWESFMETGWNTSGLALDAIRTDAYLGYLSAMAALQCHDHVTNNFYFSYQSMGVEAPGWEFYPADLDMTFGCLWDSANHNPICDTFSNDGWWLNGLFDYEDDVELGVDDYWGNLAIHSVLSHEPTVTAYEELLCKNIDSRWWNDRLPDVIYALSVDLEDDALERESRFERDWSTWEQDKRDHFPLYYEEAQERLDEALEEFEAQKDPPEEEERPRLEEFLVDIAQEEIFEFIEERHDYLRGSIGCR